MNLPDDIEVKDIDILIIGGGTAGPMAAVAAKEKNPDASVTSYPLKSDWGTF